MTNRNVTKSRRVSIYFSHHQFNAFINMSYFRHMSYLDSTDNDQNRPERVSSF